MRHDQSVPISEIDHWIGLCDKDHFIKYSTGEITFNQLKRLIAERKYNMKYVTLDDLREHLDPETIKAAQQQRKPGARKSAGNYRCSKSINFCH